MKDHQNLFDTAIQAVKGKEYEKALSLFMRFKAGEPRYHEAQMAQATILANQGRYEEAIAVLKHVLETDNLCEEAYYLLGVLYNRSGRFDKAADMLRKTLYVNPQNPLASFYLAEIYLRQGNSPMARKSFQNTLKTLEGLPSDQVIPLSGDLTARLLSQTCSKQLELIENT
jgi:tetratricopeptide (TPR) repeat protein